MLGNSGVKVSCIELSGYHLGTQRDEQESIRISQTGVDEGLNFPPTIGGTITGAK